MYNIYLSTSSIYPLLVEHLPNELMDLTKIEDLDNSMERLKNKDLRCWHFKSLIRTMYNTFIGTVSSYEEFTTKFPEYLI